MEVYYFLTGISIPIEGHIPTKEEALEYISDYLASKKEAMKKFKSQLKSFPHSRSLECIDALAKFRGATVGKHAAESFMLIRSIK